MSRAWIGKNANQSSTLKPYYVDSRLRQETVWIIDLVALVC